MSSQRIRKNLEKIKPQCYHCKKYITVTTVDHLVPVCMKGKTSYANCVLSCEHCNIKRSRFQTALGYLMSIKRGKMKKMPLGYERLLKLAINDLRECVRLSVYRRYQLYGVCSIRELRNKEGVRLEDFENRLKRLS